MNNRLIATILIVLSVFYTVDAQALGPVVEYFVPQGVWYFRAFSTLGLMLLSGCIVQAIHVRSRVQRTRGSIAVLVGLLILLVGFVAVPAGLICSYGVDMPTVVARCVGKSIVRSFVPEMVTFGIPRDELAKMGRVGASSGARAALMIAVMVFGAAFLGMWRERVAYPEKGLGWPYLALGLFWLAALPPIIWFRLS